MQIPNESVRQDGEQPRDKRLQSGYFPEDFIPEELDLYEQSEQGASTRKSDSDQDVEKELKANRNRQQE
jgi:hypothetical protein